MNQEAALLVERLGLLPHPEGGFYRETYRASMRVQSPAHASERSAFTSIHFLLADDQYSAWHRVKSDESWFFHAGVDLAIYCLVPDAVGNGIQLQMQTLGAASGQFELTVPANRWFAAKPLKPQSHVLVSCVVAPGFEFDDFELAQRHHLLDAGCVHMPDWPFVESLLAR
jgi:uncharacterized protein